MKTPATEDIPSGSVAPKGREWTFSFPFLAPLAGFLIYLPALWYGFVWDDRYAIVNNASLQSWKTLAETLWGQMNPTVAMYRPVTGAVLFFEYRLFGLHPSGYHLTSICLHAIVCALVFQVALQLSSSNRVATFASLLFAVHAVHLEAVAWVSPFAEPLVASAILAGFLVYLRYRRHREKKWLALICLCLFVGLLTKETAMVLPLLFLALEITSSGFTWRLLQRNLPLIAALTGTVLVYALMRHTNYTGFIVNESRLPARVLLLTWPSLLLIYCRHLLLPTPLSPFYDHYYVLAASGSFWWPLLALMAIAAAGYFASKHYANGGLIRFCMLGMAFSIIPVLDLNIFQFREIMHDRFLYLPSVFFSILISQLLFGLRRPKTDLQAVPAPPSSNPIYVAVGAGIILLNMAALLIQCPVWRSDLALFSYATQIAPGNPRPAFTLAMLYLEKSDLPQAEQMLTHVVQLTAAPKALFLLGQTRLRMDHPDSAEEPLRRAIAIAPERPEQHFALGECLRRMGRIEEARTEFKAEMAIGPEFRDAASKRLSEFPEAKP